MNITTQTENVVTPPAAESWRALADSLTPAQVRHLEAAERLAHANLETSAMRSTAVEVLENLADEAAWYARHNAVAGAGRDADCIDRLRLLIHEVEPAELTPDDVCALLSIVGQSMAARGIK